MHVENGERYHAFTTGQAPAIAPSKPQMHAYPPDAGPTRSDPQIHAHSEQSRRTRAPAHSPAHLLERHQHDMRIITSNPFKFFGESAL